MTAQLDTHIRTALEAIVDVAFSQGIVNGAFAIPAELIRNAQAILDAKYDVEKRLGLAMVREMAAGIVCPKCEFEKFLEGPHGGLSINVCCGACGAYFNFAPPIGLQPIDQHGGSLFHGPLRTIAEMYV